MNCFQCDSAKVEETLMTRIRCHACGGEFLSEVVGAGAAESPEPAPVAWWRWSYIDDDGNADADVQIGANMPTDLVSPPNGFNWEPLYAAAPLGTPAVDAATPSNSNSVHQAELSEDELFDVRYRLRSSGLLHDIERDDFNLIARAVEAAVRVGHKVERSSEKPVAVDVQEVFRLARRAMDKWSNIMAGRDAVLPKDFDARCELAHEAEAEFTAALTTYVAALPAAPKEPQ